MNSFVFTYGLEEIDSIAEKLLSLLEKGIVLFNGDMGSGKTTLIASLMAALGSKDNVTSPTFSIVNEYVTPEGKAYHFDFYRIESIDEALNFGVDEYIGSNKWQFIEWPERISPLLPQNSQMITITSTENNKRTLELTINNKSLTEINAMNRF